jgi:drug/metabolite transporter (DMT)-like permease
MLTGILCAIAACACWALVFVVPEFLVGFHAVEISLVRFLFYGFISFSCIITTKRRLFSKKHLPDWKTASFLALISTILSYTGTVYNVQFSGSTIATLVFGMAPITIALAGNWHKKEYPLQRLLLPLALMILGIFLAKFKGFNTQSESVAPYLLGIFLGLIGLSCWTWFVVANSSYIKEHENLSVSDWALMLGTSTFFLCIVIGAFLPIFAGVRERFSTFTIELKDFLIAGLLLGSIGTWLALFLWNYAAKKIPISIAGQLAILETVFALIYIFIIERRLPSLPEFGGIFFMISGILLGFKLFKSPHDKTPHL